MTILRRGIVFSLITALLAVASQAAEAKPLRALLIAGGCCHDYTKQHLILSEGIQKLANVRVDVYWTDSKTTKPSFPLYDKDDWAAGYDIIIHDECAADIKDLATVRRIIDTHKNIPAVNLHCAMHSYRTGTDDWFKYLGIQSSAHGPQEPIALTVVNRTHPITSTATDWTTIKEELYNNIFIFDGQALIRGKQRVKEKDVESVVAWTNEKQGARTFSTTIGHNNETVSDPRYLELVTRGLLWACDKLNADYLKPYKGEEHTITFIKAPPAPPPAPKKNASTTPVNGTATAVAAAAPAGAGNAVTAPAAANVTAAVAAQPAGAAAVTPAASSATGGDPYKNEGNVPPKIVKLTPEQEAAILKDVKVPEGFDVTLFANSAAANYPVFVAAAPNGDLYVSSDGNGSLDRAPHRGRILRLRDTDGDGRADQVTEFVKDVDSPRGLVWDHDRLYLIHPPDVSVYIDRDGDGVAEESKTLIKGIAFGFADRPADHTTNGLSMGIDGWLYVAGGDFGFMDAVGTDGRHVQHRGGGVLRFRPDGSGLEIFSRGTRNIVEVAVGPKLEIFARDNTNDGGGWDIRFENFTGLEHQGYPYLYKNFGAEHVAPLADYGGGSGCGAVFLDEPGFGKWNGPATCDWGTGALWHHSVKPEGGSFVEMAPPEKFIAMTRPTDADVDALSHVYQASWKGASFKWIGPDIGYIVRVSPKGFTPAPLIDFVHASDADLVKALESNSHRTRMAAQRALLLRADKPETKNLLLTLAGDKAKPLATRVAALYGITQRSLGGAVDASVEGLAADVALQPYVLRALADVGYVTSVEKKTAVALASFAAGLKSTDAKVKLEAIVGAVHQQMIALAPQIAALLGDADARVAHTAFRGLAVLDAHEAAFAILDSTSAPAAQRAGAVMALQLMHDKPVVDGVLAHLAKETALERRKGLLSVLCRLHFTDGVWKGDSWGTRPDTRGPYYQPDAWSETPRIGAALKELLAKAPPAEAGFLVAEMNRNRIQSNEALERIIALAVKDPALAPTAVAQMATVEDIPKDGIPLLAKVARETTSEQPAVLAQVITAIVKTDSPDANRAMLSALVALDGAKGSNKEQETGRNAFNNATRLDVVHEVFEDEAAKVGTPTAAWAEAALLKLSTRNSGSPEARDSALKALNQGWENPARRVQIIRAADKAKSHALDEKILAALDDPAPEVARAARTAVASLKIERRARDNSPLIGALKPEDVVAQVVKTKGDVNLGEQLFSRQTCVSCHTVSQSELQKGPYLGNIAQTYNRTELAQNILDPNKTIAQGFATEVIKLKDGSQQVGFITLESADNVKLRNVTSAEFTFATKDIAERVKLPISVMPPGLVDKLTVREFASLLDYLEALVKK